MRLAPASEDGNAQGDTPQSGQALASPSSSELAQALDLCGAPVAIVDCFGDLRLANRPLQDLLQRDDAALRNSPIAAWLRPFDGSDNPATALLEAASKRPGEPRQAAVVTASGASIAVSLESTPLTNDADEQVMVCCTLRPQAASAESMVGALGRLTTTLAHDFNSHLSAVLNYSFILGRQLETETQTSFLRELQAAAWRASRLANSLRRFGSRDLVSRAPAADALVLELSPLLQRILGSAQLELHVEPQLPTLKAARTDVEWLLFGLAGHATSVLGSHGLARLSAERSELGVRFTLELSQGAAGSGSGAGELVRPALPPGFRRALKRSGARLSRRGGRVELDMPAEDAA